MKKTRSIQTQNVITVILVRPTEEDQTITLPTNSTVEEALAKFEFELPAGQSLYVGDSRAEMLDALEDGDILQVVGKKEGGAEFDIEPADKDTQPEEQKVPVEEAVDEEDEKE